MDYCKEYQMWVEEIEDKTGSICPVHADQIFKTGSITGCNACRFLYKVDTKEDKRKQMKDRGMGLYFKQI